MLLYQRLKRRRVYPLFVQRIEVIHTKAILTVEIEADENLCLERGVDPVDFVKKYLKVGTECGMVFVWPDKMPPSLIQNANQNQDIIQKARLVTSIVTQRKKH